MPFLTLHSLPKIRFAHSFCAENYHGRIPAKDGYIEISVIVSGSFCATQNGKSHTAREGDVVCNLYQTPLLVDTDVPHCHHTACFAVDFDLPDEIEFPLVLRDRAHGSNCRALIDGILHSFALRPENEWKTAGLFLQLLGEIENSVRRDGERMTPGEGRYVTQAKRYVLDHISQPVTQKEIATHLGITPEYLCNVFKKSEGRSLLRFVNETKLALIRNMMEGKGIPLHRAALQYGFSDPNYVSRLFKKYYGCPITELLRGN